MTSTNYAEREQPYFDPRTGAHTVTVLPGDYYTTDRDYLIVTVLGSCVAACLRDERLGIGGMNHFMLPATPVYSAGSAISRVAAYGIYAMDVLIGALVKRGSRREDLVAKVFGGAAVTDALPSSRIGTQNAAFVLEYLRCERIRLAAADLEGLRPRKIFFSPRTGRVDVKYLDALRTGTLATREAAYLHSIVDRPLRGEVELF